MMEEVKVLVPSERVTEFYRWFADWSDGLIDGGSTGQMADASPDSGDQSLAAVEWWKSLKHSERALWNLWIDEAPRTVTADDIVRRLELQSTRAIPGILAWSRRKGHKVGFNVAWQFGYDANGKPFYGLEDEAYAQLIADARDAAS